MASGIIFPSRANLGNTFAGCHDRRPSVPTSPQQDGRRESVSTIRTRSIGGPLSAGVVFERDPNAVPSDDDIIIVTVKISKKIRRNSYDDPLPERYFCSGPCLVVSGLMNLADRRRALSYAG